MKKKKTKKLKTELQFPKQLNREDLFRCPIWYGDESGFVLVPLETDTKVLHEMSMLPLLEITQEHI